MTFTGIGILLTFLNSGMQSSLLNTVKVGLAVLLFLCLLDWPYGYFMLVRVVATVCFGVFAFAEKEAGREGTMILFIALGLLFQPLVKLPLGRELWNIVDVLLGIGLLVWAGASSKAKS
jgi:hypothetical protein